MRFGYDSEPQLVVELLGDFRAVAGAQPLTSLNTPRLQALFAYLLLHRHSPQGRRHLAFLFWPDSSERQAQTNLRNLIMALRHALPEADRFVSIERQTLQWREGTFIDLDVARFEKALAQATPRLDSSTTQVADETPGPGDLMHSLQPLQRAVDLYTGDLLPSCYDEWILPVREQLRENFLAALTRFVHLLEQNGNIATAILYGQRLVRHDPLREDNYRLVMRLHLAIGDRAGLANTFRACERVMRRELGVTPSQATLDLLRQAEQLSAQDEGELQQGRRVSRARNASRPSGNLPAQTTPFVGRESHVTALSDSLRRKDVRLVTLTGTAGTGKTRLALQVAHGFVPTSKQTRRSAGSELFADGVYFVALAALAEPNEELVLQTIASTLGLAEATSNPLRDTLVQALRDKKVLLVLDNYEHLLATTLVVSDLLAACPNLKVIVTSRALLNLRGEHEYVVLPMIVPSHDSLARPEDLLQYETVALFVDRAVQALPSFALGRGNARAVAEICRRLEGLPLAIELAAARVKVLSPEAILSRLDRRLKLLVGGKVDLPPRQRALKTAIEWSYNLLNQVEQTQFRKLAVFSGGCTLEAAEAMVGNGQDSTAAYALDNITSLVNKSLVSRVDAGTPENSVRFTMLETIREYALEKLKEQSEEVALQREHARYFMALAEEAEPHLTGPLQKEGMDQLEDEHDNFRAALRWASIIGGGAQHDEATQEAAEIGLRIAGALWQFWVVRGYHSEGRTQIESALATSRTAGVIGKRELQPYMANALYGAGQLALQQDDYISSLAFHEQALSIQRELGDKLGIASSLQSMGFAEQCRGNIPAARTFYEQGLALQREIGDRLGITYSLLYLGSVAHHLGDYEEAQSLFEQCLVIGREIDHKFCVAQVLDQLASIKKAKGHCEDAKSLYEQSLALMQELGHRGGIAEVMSHLASLAFSQGNYEPARSLYKQSLAIRRVIGDRYGIAVCLAGLGGIAVSKPTREQSEIGAKLLGVTEALMEAIGGVLSRVDHLTYKRGVAVAREVLGEIAFEEANLAGRSMTLERALDLADDII